jgi:hypothetical protein
MNFGVDCSRRKGFDTDLPASTDAQAWLKDFGTGYQIISGQSAEGAVRHAHPANLFPKLLVVGR